MTTNDSKIVSAAKEASSIVIDETRETYFIIIYHREEKDKPEDLAFQKIGTPPQCIYTKKIRPKNEEKNTQIIKVFKLTHKMARKNSIFYEFKVGTDQYEISFEIKDKIFIYDLNLKMLRGTLARNIINQNSIDYFEKMTHFIEALTENKESEKIENLYEETVSLYSRKVSFPFLIQLFIKVYDKKDLCKNLLKQFFLKIDDKKNKDRPKSLEDYKEIFKNIKLKVDQLIEDNDYDPIDFCGLILIYFNSYCYDEFLDLVEKLYESSKKTIFEILLKYKPHLNEPIKSDFDFLNNFIYYAAGKEYKTLLIGLSYISDIKIFLKVIEANKETMITIQKFKALIIDDKKIFNEKNEVSEINELIEKIINFSKEHKKLLVFFKNDFWDELAIFIKTPSVENIQMCFSLRNKFNDYYELVKILYKEDHPIVVDAEKCKEIDNYGYLLDKIIKRYIKEDSSIKNEEIITLITNYDVFYMDISNVNNARKRDASILEKLNFEEIDDDFIKMYKECNFEKIFKNNKNNIDSYITVLTSKISKIADFEIVLKLINIDEIQNLNTYMEKLDEKYDEIVNNEISILKDEELQKSIKIISSLFNFIYINLKNNLEFLQKKLQN